MKQYIMSLAIVLSTLAWVRCASTGSEENILETSLADQPLQSVNLTEEKKTFDYQAGDQKAQVEAFACVKPGFTQTALINHDETEPFVSGKVCKIWSTQSFANKGYNVIAVNRPGFGGSKGTKDFSGSRSQAAILGAVNGFSVSKTAPVTLIWGYSTGSIAAAFASKKIKTTKQLIIGNGIFDTETLAASPVKDAVIQNELDLVIKSEGDDGHEYRSIEWDVEGLPNTIFLYHSEMNPIVSYKRAESVKTTLATAEFQVQLFPVKNDKKDIDWPTHQQVLRSILSKIK